METFAVKIYEILCDVLPAGWGKIVLHASIGPASQTVFFYIQNSEDKKYYADSDLIKIGIFSKKEHRNVCIETGEASRNYLQSFDKKWTGYTLVITKDGAIKADFEFDKQSLDIPESWKKKYLN